MGIEAPLQLLDGRRLDEDQKRRTLELALERARYEAKLAQRQYDNVDPTNRLVVELEARWNAALARVTIFESLAVPLDVFARKGVRKIGGEPGSNV
jgi:hypothetical protein